ncbi:alpha/beta hydrolase [Roseiterribacter gracilis]|uniref:Alpha/beta hydrolase fold-3 domain-containing protein n=1 Tax=Roseiterribacter gracilis TaxID=2812848 RepID=A0A8S8X712_9PROT|nr:hypothetical protein TMPK1_02310 [Rhodospirillales bacterium TMPK1]
MGTVRHLTSALAALLLSTAAIAADIPDRVTDLRRLLDNAGRVASPTKVASVEDRTIDGLRLRIYDNNVPGRGPKSRPALLMLHGGGWIAGSVATHDEIARILSVELKAKVVSLDYSLSPEARYPQARDEAFAALRWMAQESSIDPTRIAVLGDSSGGNLAAVLALLARDQKGPRIVAQVLINPVVDLAGLDTDSYQRVGSEPMQFYRAQYLRAQDDPNDPYISPLRAHDLRRLPPALVVIAGRDALQDEDEAYLRRLHQANVATERLHLPDEPHLAMRWATGNAKLRSAIDTTVQFLRRYMQ